MGFLWVNVNVTFFHRCGNTINLGCFDCHNEFQTTWQHLLTAKTNDRCMATRLFRALFTYPLTRTHNGPDQGD